MRAAVTPATLPGTATHRLQSNIIPDTLQIDVSLPYAYERDDSRRYPVVYLTDGYWFFPIVSAAMQLLELSEEMPPLIIAGIGYAPGNLSRTHEDERFSNLRCRDLTPTHDTTDWWRRAGSPKPLAVGVETGHAAGFIQVLENEVKPLVRRQYRTDTQDETLAGFSLGGLFALHVLFEHTSLFKRYLAGSPALWWDKGAIFESERRYAATNRDLNAALFLSMGSLEEDNAGPECGMVSNLCLMSERLTSRGYPSLKCETLILENETHATGIAPTFVKGLRAVFR